MLSQFTSETEGTGAALTHERSFAILVAMLRRLSKMGNGVGLILDKQVLDALRIDQHTEVDISTDGSIITIRPMHASQQTGRMYLGPTKTPGENGGK